MCALFSYIKFIYKKKIFNSSSRVVSVGKVNILGALYRSTIFQQFSKTLRKPKKVTENWEFLHKTSFDQIDFFLYGCNSKTNQ